MRLARQFLILLNMARIRNESCGRMEISQRAARQRECSLLSFLEDGDRKCHPQWLGGVKLPCTTRPLAEACRPPTIRSRGVISAGYADFLAGTKVTSTTLVSTSGISGKDLG